MGRGGRGTAAAGEGSGRGLLARRLLALRCEHHGHVAAVLLGPLLDDGELFQVLREAVEDHLPPLGVGHLAAAEHDRDLDLVARLQEALDVALLGVVVMLRDLRPELDLPDVDLLLVLARGLLLLGLLVLVLRVVQDTADGRLGLGGDFHQVQLAALGVPEGLSRLHDPDLLAVLVDEAHLGDADAFVDAGGVALRRLPVEPTRDRHLADGGATGRQTGRRTVGIRVINALEYSRRSASAHGFAPRARPPRRRGGRRARRAARGPRRGRTRGSPRPAPRAGSRARAPAARPRASWSPRRGRTRAGGRSRPGSRSRT